MSDLSGLGIIEIAVLNALDDLGAGPASAGVKSNTLLGELAKSLGIGPHYGYKVLCDLGQWWTVPLCLVDIVGNVGSPDSSPAGPQYTEVRLSLPGSLALAAEREEGPPVPIGLINGNTYSGGLRPPFDRGRIMAALAHLADKGAPAHEVIQLVGLPEFPTGCEVGGQVDRLFHGEPAVLKLSAQLRRSSNGPSTVIEITNFPPGIGPFDLSARLSALATRPTWADHEPELARVTHLPLEDVQLEGDAQDVRLLCLSEKGVAANLLEHQIRRILGVTISLPTQLDGPLASVLGNWVSAQGHEKVKAGLVALQALS